MSARAGVGIFVSPRLAHCLTDWIRIRGRFHLLKLRLQEGSLCILQMYAPNAEAQYQPFLDEVIVVLQKVTSAESILLLGDFNVHVCTDTKTWKGVIGRQGDSDINRNGSCLRQLYFTNGLCIGIPFIGTRVFSSKPGTEIRWNSVLSLISVLSQETCFL